MIHLEAAYQEARGELVDLLADIIKARDYTEEHYPNNTNAIDRFNRIIETVSAFEGTATCIMQDLVAENMNLYKEGIRRGRELATQEHKKEELPKQGILTEKGREIYRQRVIENAMKSQPNLF